MIAGDRTDRRSAPAVHASSFANSCGASAQACTPGEAAACDAIRRRQLHRSQHRRRFLARTARHRADPHDPEPARATGRDTACSNSLQVPQPPPPLRIPISEPRHHRRRSSGIPTSANGSKRRATRSRTAATPPSKRRSTTSPTGSRAAQLPDGYLNCWYIGRAAGKTLDQPARLPRALLRRPSARRRGRLFPSHRPAALARHHAALRRPHRDHFRPRRRARSAATAAIRRSSSR